jgi:hypothetical protein
MLGLGQEKVMPPPAAVTAPGQEQAAEDAKKKKGFFGKFVGIFKDDKPSNPPAAKPPDANGTTPQ